MDSELQDIKDYLNIQSDKVRKNSKIIGKDELGQSFMLHIDIKTPNYFIPMMPRRAAPSEDNTTPRVTVSDSILGCIIGYSKLPEDFLAQKDHGLYINKIDFNYCLQVSDKLVYDASVSNEHWLVPYNRNNLKYKPETIGKIFVGKLEYKRDPNRKHPLVEMTEVYIEVAENITIRFDENNNITKGYYKASVNLSHLDEKDLSISPVTAAEYMKAKNLSASMLDMNSTNIPLFKKWS